MKKELEKTYDPSKTEKETYQTWCDNGYFLPKENSSKGTYTIVIPPPSSIPIPSLWVIPVHQPQASYILH